LAWLPVPDESADSTAVILDTLFHWHGPPLVMKSDNGSAFKSQRLHDLLRRWAVVALLSPPRMPQYNGSCEAGIGSMKVRTAYLAAKAGRPLHWSSDDLEAARRQANEFHRPGRPAASTPQEVWRQRSLITQPERALFAATLLASTQRMRPSLESLRERAASPPPDATSQRQAVRQTLVELGLLSITRRSLTLPIKRLKSAKLM
jgi:hypothetical protein